MANITYPFEAVSQEDWVLKIQKELREHADRMRFEDPIEDLNLLITEIPTQPVEFQQIARELTLDTIHSEFVHDEAESNRRILLALMSGANALFIQSKKENTNWKRILEQVELSYIQVEIQVRNEAEWIQLRTQLSESEINQIHVLVDQQLGLQLEGTRPFFDGFSIQQIGGNSITELTAILLQYHRHLSTGGSSEVTFSIGIGANYFVQIAKVRALHYLIQKLDNIHQKASAYRLIAELGWTNKSLKDPYTNLLRLTTEAMSAYAGGVHGIAIHPWDEFSVEGKEDFSLRMSLNISNLLLEEAHFDWVHDPMKGSHMVEALSIQFIEKTWSRVQSCSQLTKEEADEQIMASVLQSRNKQLEAFKNGTRSFIGINAYLNSDKSKVKNWSTLPTYMGMNFMNFELNGSDERN